MIETLVALAVVLAIVAVPRGRRTFFSMLALFAIIGAGTAVFGAAVWALYQSKTWLHADTPAIVKESPPEGEEVADSHDPAAADLMSALAREEEARLRDEQRRRAEVREQERQRIETMSSRARAILEMDRKLAEHATSHPLPLGADTLVGDLVAIRIPAWRDKELAAVEKESIRTWLQSIGLRSDETASIISAKAWGSLYDMWVAETRKGHEQEDQGPAP